MKIHGICLVKNEADILRYFLRSSVRWCDHIYILDNGSTDATWEIVLEMAREAAQIVPFRREEKPFNDVLRAEVFNHFRDRARTGDWWCRLDADEIYIDDPRTFLAAVPKSCQVVWSVHLQFYPTPLEVAEFDARETSAIPEVSEQNLPKYYAANASEGRFFRHRAGLRWTTGAWPTHVGLVARERIRLKHFQYRSPAQMRDRLAIRRETEERGGQTFSHWQMADWREVVVDPQQLRRDAGDGRYEIDERLLPCHLEPAWQRVMKYVMHGAGIWP
jgi:hypothetical protein